MENYDYTLFLSYGKDSVACLGAIKQLGLQLTAVIHVGIKATEELSADPPPMVEFKSKVNKYIKDEFGIEVETVYPKYTYEELFYTTFKSGKRTGEIYGWPMLKGPWCNDRLKIKPVRQIQARAKHQYVGIAMDEPVRLARLEDNKISPLELIGWTEADCLAWCKEHDLLSPVYQCANRAGCWFCHNQSVDQLRKLRQMYPEYWQIMLKWDKDSNITFKPGRTLHDYDNRFQLEDAGLVPQDRKFRWSMIEKEGD